MSYTKLMEVLRSRLLSVNAKILKDNIGLFLEKEEIEYYEKDYGIILNNELSDFYTTLNGVQFRWKLDSLFGYLSFNLFENFVARENDGDLWVDWYEEEDISEMKTHFVLEYIDGTDSYITMKIDEIGNYNLYYIPDGAVNFGGSKELDVIPLTLEQYFRIVTGYYGLDGLRDNLHKDEFYTRPFDVFPKLRELEKIFPDFQPPEIKPL